MKLSKLRLIGFKSFVESTEISIEPGLTGIVGPNGCGKSNLVEALRWVMGEASAKRLRGGEMDDVIFAGSAGRPARNLAEVALTLDNSTRDAPFAYNESSTLEVARRITRGDGSSYRINGREARARDVQLLFADAATGPHSGALVSQGRIGALVAAKPEERRLLLDEAAGTAAQRIAHAREALEQELGRIVAARAEAERRLAQVQADRERETGHLADAEAALARLADEERSLQRAGESEAKEQIEAEARHRAAGAELAAAETGLQQMTAACATGEARRAALARPRHDLAARRNRLQARLADGEQQRMALDAALVSEVSLAQAAAAVAE